MNEVATIVVGGNKSLMDVLYELMQFYDFNLTYTTEHKFVLEKRKI